MRVNLPWRYVIFAILAALWMTAISAYIPISSEKSMGSSCAICADIQVTGDIQHMGVPLAYITHYPAATLNGDIPAHTDFSKSALLADGVIWMSVALVGAWLINNSSRKHNTARKAK